MKAIVYIIMALLFLLKNIDTQAQYFGKEHKIFHLQEEADSLFSHFEYMEAIYVYKKILAVDSSIAEVKIKIAEAYYKLQHHTAEAEEWYRKGISGADSSKVLPSSIYAYAEVLYSNGKKEESLQWYRIYQQYDSLDTRVNKKIKDLVNSSDLYKDSVLYKIIPVNINSKHSDFSPSFYEDGILFVSAREESSISDKKDLDNSFFDIYYSGYKDSSFMPPVKFSDVLNTKFHEGPLSVYDHNNKIIFTRSNFADGETYADDERTIHLQLLYSEKNDKGEWKEPTLLSINDRMYSLGHPSISENEKYLYFSSNAPGGHGGTDIYVCEWRDSIWSSPKNLGAEINTSGDELFPCIHNDSILYFSSTGHGGLGGLDIYWFNVNTHQLINPGYPINSSKDDFGFVGSKKDTMYLFSSNRNGDDDIYRAVKQEAKIIINKDSLSSIDNPIEVYYTVQILALINPRTVKKSFLKDLTGVLKHDGKDGFHRYTYGIYANIEEATIVLNQIRAKGYDDAFIRKEKRYKELSKRPGVDVEILYSKEIN